MEHLYEVWLVGELGTECVDRLYRELELAARSGKRMLKLRFYLKDRNDPRYYEVMRGLLLKNALLSIFIEDRSLEDFSKDLMRKASDVTVIKGLEQEGVEDGRW